MVYIIRCISNRKYIFGIIFVNFGLMKKYLLFLVFALCSVTLFAGKTDKQTVVLSVDLHCQACCDKIMKNIAFEKGVKDIVCDLKTKTVTVTYDANKTDVPTLLEAFKKINKPATVKENAPNATR